jgi:predicted Zn-dependent protease
LVQAAGTGVDVYLQQKPSAQNDLFKRMYGTGSSLGLLSYSRKQELEADKLGLVFMAMAGYNPTEAVAFWQRMAAQGGSTGAAPPEFLSTHPSNANRIAKIQAYLPQALKYYTK